MLHYLPATRSSSAILSFLRRCWKKYLAQLGRKRWSTTFVLHLFFDSCCVLIVVVFYYFSPGCVIDYNFQQITFASHPIKPSPNVRPSAHSIRWFLHCLISLFLLTSERGKRGSDVCSWMLTVSRGFTQIKRFTRGPCVVHISWCHFCFHPVSFLVVSVVPWFHFSLMSLRHRVWI